MKRTLVLLLIGFALSHTNIFCQQRGLINTSGSPFVSMQSVDMDDVIWTNGFWAERFNVCSTSMVPGLYETYSRADISHSFKNFEIAAGLDTGRHMGPPFHDGDFYKLLESIASVYASTKDERLDALMDKIITVIAKAQRSDGYIHTPVIIEQKKKAAKKEFEDRLNFETYNLGHLMTAACVHYRATGKKTLLNVAIKAADYLSEFYNRASPELARNAICPSHYMGVVEMYRTTRNPDYLRLAKNLINIRGYVENGTDDNQDRIPFRKQHTAMGHAVRANYLYAGVADVYAETGEDSLLLCLKNIWEDVAYRKLYITGACGALYDGVSPYGVSYKPVEIQKTHQSYGRAYQLPNITAHNETCANIGNVLWNWRMLQITGDGKHADMVELALYNSVLSGISLDGKDFFYTNPLAASNDYPYQLRWFGRRKSYIGLSNCCPPNTVRTIAQISNYFYSHSEKGVWFNLYGGNKLDTKLADGSSLKLVQETDYPWNGNVTIRITEAPRKNLSLFLRIPGWSDNSHITINGQSINTMATAGYVELNRKWSKNDVILLELPMPAKLLEANPLVEETRNQVAVKRGPIVYCIESVDVGHDVQDIILPVSIKFTPDMVTVGNTNLLSLTGEAKIVRKFDWTNRLYNEVSPTPEATSPIRLIPYYAWGNRGSSEMTVWIPVSR
jgi:DUF1680 family protein